MTHDNNIPANASVTELTDEQVNAARYMALTGIAVSDQAKAMAISLCSQIYPSGRRKSASDKYRQALGAVVSDLIRAMRHDASRYSYRPMGIQSFTGHLIGYRPCKRVIDHMTEAGLLEVHTGYKDPAHMGEH